MQKSAYGEAVVKKFGVFEWHIRIKEEREDVRDDGRFEQKVIKRGKRGKLQTS